MTIDFPAYPCPGCSAHPGPLAAGPALHLEENASAFSRTFFIRFDSRRLTPGGCFPQNRFPRPTVCKLAPRAVLRNLFRRPCAPFWGRAGLRSVATREGCSPSTSAGSRPCTCPEPPFMTAPGPCAIRHFAEANQRSSPCRTNFVPENAPHLRIERRERKTAGRAASIQLKSPTDSPITQNYLQVLAKKKDMIY